jgi:hypothetical protein
MTSPSSTVKVQVLVHKTGETRSVDRTALRWFIDQHSLEIRTGVTREEMREGDRPYLPVEIHWSSPVTVLRGMRKPKGASAGFGRAEARRVRAEITARKAEADARRALALAVRALQGVAA